MRQQWGRAVLTARLLARRAGRSGESASAYCWLWSASSLRAFIALRIRAI